MSFLSLKDLHVTLKDFEDARNRIHEYLEATVFIQNMGIADWLQYPGKIFFKLDNRQPTGSFKVRGAFNNILQLSPQEAKAGVVTRSCGNFAQAVAYAAKRLNCPSTIVMPPNAPKTKIEGTKKWGATVLFTQSPTQEEGEQLVEKLSQEKGLTQLHPYNSLRTLIGQGTAALEIVDECNKQDIDLKDFYCPIGGGGLLSGCSIALKESIPSIIIHGIEPEGASDYYQSRKQGKLISIDKIDTIADGLRSSSVGEI